MTAEERAKMEAEMDEDRRQIQELLTNPGYIDPDPKPVMTPYGEQDTNGVDLSLIRSNLQLTPTQRAARSEKATLEALYIRRHARRIA